MTAVFNAPESGDGSVAKEARTSAAPQFDLKALYADMGATAQSGTRRDTGNQLDFGTGDNLYARSSDNQSGSNGSSNFEQQTAMDVARRFASFDDDTDNNTNEINLDREDVGRLVEVYGYMYNMQDSLQDGDRSEAQDWLGEMRRDLASFTRGLFTNTDSEERTRVRDGRRDPADTYCPDEHGSDEQEGQHERGHEEEESGGEDQSEEQGETTEDGWEHTEPCPPSDGRGESGSEGYTPEDSMVLLQDDMQDLTEALASGDPQAVQQVMARMNRHMALLMRQLNPRNEDGGSDGNGREPNPWEDWLGTSPIEGRPGRGNRPGDMIGIRDPLDSLPFLPNPGRLPNPGDILNGLPNPGDILNGLPNPGDLLNGLQNPGDLLAGLPNPGDIFAGLPQPPNPGDILRGLPQPPNPGDLLRGLPQPPNPSDLLRNLPSPSDLFDIF